MNKLNQFSQNLIAKFKENKKIFFVVSLVFLALVFCLLLFNKSSNSSDKDVSYDSNYEYASYLESKVKQSLKSIENVGNVSVTITFDGGVEYVYAQEEETKTTSSGSITSSSLVLVSGKPVLVKEVYPKIKGIVIVASGAKNIKVKMDILQAVQTVLDVTNEKITILN